MQYLLIKYIVILLFSAPNICIHSPVAFAENGIDLNRQVVFLAFERKAFDLLDSGMEPLNELDEVTLDESLDVKKLHNFVVSARQTFGETSLAFAKLKVPAALPDDIKASLGQIKVYFSTGFKELGESLDFYRQYMESRNPLLFEKFIEQRDKGVSHIDGALTLLNTVRMQLNPPKLKPNAWTVARRHLYELQSIDAFVPWLKGPFVVN
ncbi:hypothetical protein [Paenibacillus illinoisensis]|uniref:Uncharacterized protein n=1 Tax=Paenibacillus illinoisensis TaxID=59845 RepID=A0A2W0CAM2_9BACL|nr:hypothetical protein [Paenibacillus illinoisensis]PYY29730.1 Uncharacterized protein PIL02S_01930 [Paenibacillus illinoisensis]